MAELHHECGLAAVYYLPNRGVSPFLPKPDEASQLIPRMLPDMQIRRQLAAGMTTYNVRRKWPFDTHKEVGSVAEVFHLNHGVEFERLMVKYAGAAAINCRELRDELLSQPNLCLARGTDTEIVMHLICQEMSGGKKPRLVELVAALAQRLDGAYNIVFLNALGDMFVARDPQGIRPMCYAVEGPLFTAASESVALARLGFRDESIKSLEPGHTVIIESGVLTE